MKFPATCVVHWPTGPVNCCDKHARALVGLSNMLGSHVGVTKIETPAECKNCVHEDPDRPLTEQEEKDAQDTEDSDEYDRRTAHLA